MQGSSALSSLLRSPHCCLRVLVVCKCELGLLGVVHVLQALSGNRTLKELNLAENITLDEAQVLKSNIRSSQAGHFSPAPKNNEPCSLKVASHEIGDAQRQEMHADTGEHQLEVPDSEDELAESSFTVFPNKIRHAESQPMQELSSSIEIARSLEFLDLSDNGFSDEVTDIMFSAWCSGGRAGMGRRHVDGNTVHYSLQGNKCCGIKSCCRNI